MRAAFWTAIAAFVASSACVAAHAQTSGQPADCVKLPTQATFQSGAVLTVIARNDGKMQHETATPDGSKVTMLTYGGLFTLRAETPTVTLDYRWNQDLAQYFPLKVGQRIAADAVAKNSADTTTASYVTEMNVLGIETIPVASCNYSVFRVETRAKLGTQQGVSTKYYHADSMFTLRNVMRVPNSPTLLDDPVVRLQ